MVTQVLGPDGLPVRSLQKPVTYPAVSGLSQVSYLQRTRDLIGRMTPARLEAILREAEDGDAEDYLELAEELEERDPHYQGVLVARKRQVAELDITVEAASDDKADQKAADLVREWLDRESLQDEIFHLLDALGKGYACLEVAWAFDSHRWWPERLAWRDPRLFRFDYDTGRHLRLRGLGGWESDLELPAWRFVVHQPQAKSGLPIRGGLARIVAWGLMVKRLTMADWAGYAEVFGQPLRVGKYDAAATQRDVNVLRRALAGLSREAAAVIPEQMQIEFVSPQGSGKAGPDVYARLVTYIDQQISKAVLGQTTTTDAISGGHAVSKEHRQVAEDIERSDARDVAATLNRQVIRPLVAFNIGPQARYPRVRIGRSEDRDLATTLKAVQALAALGVPLSANQLRGIYRLEEPDGEDDALRPVPPPAVRQEQDTKTDAASAVATAAASSPGRSPLDDLEADLEDLPEEDWQKLVGGAVADIDRALQTDRPETAHKGLASLGDRPPTRTETAQVARAAFSARIAGALGVDRQDT